LGTGHNGRRPGDGGFSLTALGLGALALLGAGACARGMGPTSAALRAERPEHRAATATTAAAVAETTSGGPVVASSGAATARPGEVLPEALPPRAGRGVRAPDAPPVTAAALRAATVALLGRGGFLRCAGALVERPDLVVTAAHCVARNRTGQRLPVRLSDGARRRATLLVADPRVDLAVLLLPAPASAAALPVASSDDAVAGTPVLFLGRPLKRRSVQRGSIARRAPCRHLPAIRDAIFGRYRASPGDSGAAIVTSAGLVGIVHGGRGCRIAVPSSYLRGLLERVRHEPPPAEDS
jgi:hypothetical protein